jgi:hypothetical protein
VDEEKIYDRKCKADLYFETKVLKSLRDAAGIHDGQVVIEEVDPGE